MENELLCVLVPGAERSCSGERKPGPAHIAKPVAVLDEETWANFCLYSSL